MMDLGVRRQRRTSAVRHRRRPLVMLVVLSALFAPAGQAMAATTVPILWEAGGLDAGTGSAGQANRVTSDADGNVTVLSGGSTTGFMTVTSYTAGGQLRWRESLVPASGHYAGRWIETAPDGDVVVIAANLPNSSSSTIAIGSAVFRFSSDGTLEWQTYHAGTQIDYIRMVLDAQGNTYVVYSFNGTSVRKYSPTGALLWENAGGLGAGASSIALSPDGTEVFATATTAANWILIARDASTGAQRWAVNIPVGVAARDVVVDAGRVYVAGQGNIGIDTYLTVSAFDRATGAQLWRTDERPAGATGAAGLWMDMAPDGSLVVAGQASRGFLDWYTVVFETSGAVRWEAVRDGGLNTDEIPASVKALADGSTVVTGTGGPNLPGGFIQGVTGGYSSSGELVWEGFSDYATKWVTELPNADVCTVGGPDAYISCFRPSGTGGGNVAPTAAVTATPLTGTAPLTVSFDASGSTDPDGTISSWSWNFGDGGTAGGAVVQHQYTNAGTYTVTVTVTDDDGAIDAESVTVTVSATGSTVVHLSSSSGGTVGGVSFADEDVVKVDTATGVWSMVLDGSDVGLAAVDVDAFEVLSDGRMLLSTDIPVTLGAVRYDDSDVIAFTPTSTGSTTAGTFSMYASGASLQLTTDAEDVDAIALSPAGELLLSTSGRLSSRGVIGEDEDLMKFVGTTVSRYLDGSSIGLLDTGEDVWGASVQATGRVDFSAQAGFTLPGGLSGGAGAVGSCTPSGTPVTACSSVSLLAPTTLSAFSAEVIDAVDVSG